MKEVEFDGGGGGGGVQSYFRVKPNLVEVELGCDNYSFYSLPPVLELILETLAGLCGKTPNHEYWQAQQTPNLEPAQLSRCIVCPSSCSISS